MSKPSVTFETAGLASAVARAARVAPSKGAAYDKAAGVVLEIDPGGEHTVTVKATDLEVTFLEWIEPQEVSGITEKTMWRLPSDVFSGVLQGFPVAGEVTLRPDDKGKMQVKGGKKTSNVRMIAATNSYMNWQPFDPGMLERVEGFSKRVSEVSWAADRDAIPFTGIHMDGEYLIATDKQRMARVPCKVPIDVDAIAAGIQSSSPGKAFSPGITAPLSVVVPIFKNLTDASIAATDSKLLVMPDEYTQITTTIYDSIYPPLDRITSQPYPQSLVVEREGLKDAVLAMMVLCKGDRYPRVDFTIGQGRIRIFMDVPDVGDLEDVIEVTGADHDDFTAYYTPTNLTDCLAAINAVEVTFCYDAGNPLRMPHVTDGKSYEAWFSARRAIDPTE